MILARPPTLTSRPDQGRRPAEAEVDLLIPLDSRREHQGDCVITGFKDLFGRGRHAKTHHVSRDWGERFDAEGRRNLSVVDQESNQRLARHLTFNRMVQNSRRLRC